MDGISGSFGMESTGFNLIFLDISLTDIITRSLSFAIKYCVILTMITSSLFTEGMSKNIFEFETFTQPLPVSI